MIVAYLIVVVLMFVVINLLVDFIYSLLDPRVRLTDEGGVMAVARRRHSRPRTRAETLARAGVGRILRKPDRGGARSAVVVLLIVLALLGALDRAAEPLRPHPARRSWTTCCRRASAALDGKLYLLGTDEQGRDMLSAILYGLRLSACSSASRRP